MSQGLMVIELIVYRTGPLLDEIVNVLNIEVNLDEKAPTTPKILKRKMMATITIPKITRIVHSFQS